MHGGFPVLCPVTGFVNGLSSLKTLSRKPEKKINNKIFKKTIYGRNDYDYI